MTAAFDYNAFDVDAFDAATPSTGHAFDSSAFDDDAFDCDEVAVVTVTPSGGVAVPGYRHRTRTPEELRAERIRLGIIPAPVKRAVVKAARKAVEETPAKVDPLVWLQAQYDRRQLLLQRELEAKQIEFQQAYMLLLKIEIELILQRREDEAIIHLLMEM